MSEELRRLQLAVKTGAEYIARRSARASGSVTLAAEDAPFPIRTEKERAAVAAEVRRIWERVGAGYTTALDELRESLVDYVVAGIARNYGEAAVFLSSGRPKPADPATLIQRSVMETAKDDLAVVRQIMLRITGGLP